MHHSWIVTDSYNSYWNSYFNSTNYVTNKQHQCEQFPRHKLNNDPVIYTSVFSLSDAVSDNLYQRKARLLVLSVESNHNLLPIGMALSKTAANKEMAKGLKVLCALCLKPLPDNIIK